MKFSDFICENTELNNDPQKAVPEIQEFFKKWFKKFKVNIKTIKVDIIQNTRFGVEWVGSSKDVDEAQQKLRNKIPQAGFKGIDGRDFDFIRLQNTGKDYSIKIASGDSISGYFHIEPKNVKEFYRP